ncbi:unnamed protein product [Paramecium sonneborni]|uniref:Uncharacterized protein n=1 Tax=Paramecium sonneborni TaxID=65129 RepID=A0A8S1NS37_9CILI|nr:unnamed protein product [Paramecium sonneborni]
MLIHYQKMIKLKLMPVSEKDIRITIQDILNINNLQKRIRNNPIA